jgi:hypothetical protein
LVYLEQFSKISLRFTQLKERITGHFPVIQIAGNKKFESGKENQIAGKGEVDPD